MTLAPNLSASSISPQVSVVIPVRNAYKYILEAINSILSQGQSINFEILVIDDGSDDYDYKLLEEYDERIFVTRLKGCGVSHARNTGMAIARGEYIAFLDADDMWFPGKLIAQIRHFERNPDVSVVFGGYIRWEKNLDGIFPNPSSLISDCSSLCDIDENRSGWNYSKLLMGLLVGMNTAVIRRQLYLQLGGFDESMRIGEDYDYWLRASRITQMHALDGPVALYRIHDASAMNRLDKENHLAMLLNRAQSIWGLSNPDGTMLSTTDFNSRLAAVEFSHGYAHFWNGDATIARLSFAHALKTGYRPCRSLVYYFLSWYKSLPSLFI